MFKNKFTPVLVVSLLVGGFTLISNNYNRVKADDTDNYVIGGDDSNTDDNGDDSQDNSSKNLTINFQSTTGKVLGPSQQVSVSSDSDTLPDPEKKFNGYLELVNESQINYDTLPSSVTIKYIKITPLVKQLNTTYMKLVNKARKKAQLSPLLSSKDLQRRVNVRAQEQLQQEGHIRPNGTSYNTKNSGYAEVYSPFFLRVTPDYSGVNVKATANWVLQRLLTEDSIHRDTVLNKWSKYSNAAFHVDAEGNFVMVQLFHISK